MNHSVMLMHFLRDRQTFLDEIYKGIKINQKVLSMPMTLRPILTAQQSFADG
jgi:hypothetical protein